MNNLLKQYQGDAWSRRISSDYNKFPWSLKALFVFTHYLHKIQVFLVGTCLAITAYYMYNIIDGTWMTGGKALLSESPFLTASYTSMLLALFFWVFPPVINAALYNWYWLVRKNFKKDSAKQ